MSNINERVNKIGREVVMPSEEFIKVVSENTTNGKCDISKVAEKFDVNVDAVLYRGKELKIW